MELPQRSYQGSNRSKFPLWTLTPCFLERDPHTVLFYSHPLAHNLLSQTQLGLKSWGLLFFSWYFYSRRPFAPPPPHACSPRSALTRSRTSDENHILWMDMAYKDKRGFYPVTDHHSSDTVRPQTKPTSEYPCQITRAARSLKFHHIEELSAFISFQIELFPAQHLHVRPHTPSRHPWEFFNPCFTPSSLLCFPTLRMGFL